MCGQVMQLKKAYSMVAVLDALRETFKKPSCPNVSGRSVSHPAKQV